MDSLGIDIGIYDSSGNLITRDISGVNPVPAANKVINQLLSGEFHLQVIGTAATILRFAVLADFSVKNVLDEAEGTGESLQVRSHGQTWAGVIESPINWRQDSGIYYTGDINLLVTSE